MNGARLSRCSPTLLDFVTWAVLKGCRLFKRIHITPMGLVTTERIPCYDFVAVIPVQATQSVLNIADDTTFPLKVSPANYGDEMPFWQDLNYGSFVFVAFLAKVLLLGHPRGVQSYLEVLPFDQAMPIGKMADIAQATPAYKAAISPMARYCKTASSDFDLAYRHAYCLFRRHAIPFWTSTASWSAGHPYFQSTVFAQEGKGDIMGLVPIIDLALHSPTPNSTIGYPDAEMLQWMMQEKHINAKKDDNYFVMQAMRDIEAGEIVTVNKNAYFNFDDDTFKAWFGYSNQSQVLSGVRTVASTEVYQKKVETLQSHRDHQ